SALIRHLAPFELLIQVLLVGLVAPCDSEETVYHGATSTTSFFCWAWARAVPQGQSFLDSGILTMAPASILLSTWLVSRPLSSTSLADNVLCSPAAMLDTKLIDA